MQKPTAYDDEKIKITKVSKDLKVMIWFKVSEFLIENLEISEICLFFPILTVVKT